VIDHLSAVKDARYLGQHEIWLVFIGVEATDVANPILLEEGGVVCGAMTPWILHPIERPAQITSDADK